MINKNDEINKSISYGIFRKRFRALLKRLKLPAWTTEPGRLFQCRMIQIEKEYLYGVHFAGSPGLSRFNFGGNFHRFFFNPALALNSFRTTGPRTWFFHLVVCRGQLRNVPRIITAARKCLKTTRYPPV